LNQEVAEIVMVLDREMGKGSTHKMFCNSLVEVDLFACICLSACLLEYLVSLLAQPSTHIQSRHTIASHFVSDR
jgi:hypothetical protein